MSIETIGAETLWAQAQRVWREGFAPQFSVEELRCLREALVTDDQRLIQGRTCEPHVHSALASRSFIAATGACLVAYPDWLGTIGHDGPPVSEVERAFAAVCRRAEQRMHEGYCCRWLLNWWDDTPRAIARELMLAEVERELAAREGNQ